ncbi:MAG: hypothetical protein LBP27_06605, partial [Treponema sp.]|nr:hypothetical protein [Treponema sp.]
ERIGGILAASKADLVFLYGKETAAAMGAAGAASGAPVFRHYTEIPDLAAALDSLVCRGDLVLLKGSRGCALEKLADRLTGGRADDFLAHNEAGPPADRGGIR